MLGLPVLNSSLPDVHILTTWGGEKLRSQIPSEGENPLHDLKLMNEDVLGVGNPRLGSDQLFNSQEEHSSLETSTAAYPLCHHMPEGIE